MTVYSRSDLATRALKDLGLVAAEETPSAADLDWASETTASVAAQLATEGIAIWNGTDESVPLEYLAPLSRRIGVDMAVSYGLLSIDAAEAAKPPLNMLLRRMNAKQSSGATVKSEYY